MGIGILLASLCFLFNNCILRQSFLKELIRNDAELYDPEKDNKEYYFFQKIRVVKSNNENLNMMQMILNNNKKPIFNPGEDYFESN